MNFKSDMDGIGTKVKNEGLSTVNKAKDILGLNPKISYDYGEPDELSKLVSKFYIDKTIFKTYNFVVNFKNLTGFEKVQPYHVKSVSIPNYPTEVKTVNYGPIPKGYVVYAKDRSHIVTINFEDDFNASILKLATRLQGSIMDKDGYYNSLKNRNLGNIDIVLYSNVGTDIFMWTCVNCYFAGFGESVELSYDTTESLKIPMRFGCDAIKYTIHDYVTKSRGARKAQKNR